MSNVEAIISPVSIEHGGTGATNATSALNNLGGVAKINFIEAGVDLNTITETGIYRLSSGHTNGPAGADWNQMFVAHGGGDTIFQIIVRYSNGSIVHRAGDPSDIGGSGAWTPWVESVSATQQMTFSVNSSGGLTVTY